MYKIIIVDDEPRILDGIIHLFPWENLGFQVSGSFTNGKKALDYINSHSDIDVVMTDIQMPVMTGIELSQNLLNTEIIVVFFSAYQDFEYARSAIINHVVDYLIKPVKYQAVADCFERVRSQLDSRHTAAKKQSDDPADLTEHYISTVKQYLEENYRTASLEDAALLVHYSTTYLSSAFKTYTGTSFSRYLLQIRMEKAMSMLADKNIKFYEIADAVGYLNPKNLTRNFKDYYGITPQEFRAGKSPATNGHNGGSQS